VTTARRRLASRSELRSRKNLSMRSLTALSLTLPATVRLQKPEVSSSAEHHRSMIRASTPPNTLASTLAKQAERKSVSFFIHSR
jgi:hypothetical protein